MKEFFGFGGYARPAEGYMSWQHLLFVTVLVSIMAVLAVILGRKARGCSAAYQNRALVIAAITIDSLELFKIVLLCFRSNNPLNWLYDLPLFLCSIQLITIPLAAFSKGRTKEAATDFVCIFGLLGAILGTYAAGNNYSSYPVLCFDNLVSGLTHCISGFAALYIMIAGMATLRKRNIGITFAILLCFCIGAYCANLLLDYNYMFLMGGDGTPYDILYNLVGGHFVLYPLSVVALFLVYVSMFYGISFLLRRRTGKDVPSTC